MPRHLFVCTARSLCVVWAAFLALGCGPTTIVDASVSDAGALDAAPGDASDLVVDARVEDAPRGPDAGPPEELEAALRYWLDAGALAGLAALAVEGDVRIVFTEGRATDTTSVDAHTLFNVASVSKTFVAALALLLVEDGLLDLDAPLSAVLPDLPIVHPGHPDTPVTTRMLLTHTSGLIDDFLGLAAFGSLGDPSGELEPFVREYTSVASHWGAAPGVARSYCNACFGVLGLVLERASGRDLRTLSETRLFAPMALDGAGWFFADVEEARIATGYARRGSGYSALERNSVAFYPATSLLISLTGIERWMRMHLEGGELEGVRYLASESVEETRRVQFPAIDRGQYLTWYAQSQGGERWVGHSGSSYGASVQVRYRPESGRILVVLTNSDAYIRSRFGAPQGSEAIDAILDRLDRELDAR